MSVKYINLKWTVVMPGFDYFETLSVVDEYINQMVSNWNSLLILREEMSFGGMKNYFCNNFCNQYEMSAVMLLIVEISFQNRD